MTAKVFIVFYSLYGHVHQLAEEIAIGVEKTGAKAYLFQVSETLSPDVLAKLRAPPKPPIPVISPAHLAEADGVLFGMSTRFGTMPSQMKAFWDGTGQLWQSGALVGKPAGFFFSTATQSGGQESCALTAITQLAHHGMIYVPLGYSSPALFTMDEVKGGSPYGSGTVAGKDGRRRPSQIELELARHQGETFAMTVLALKRGRTQTALA